MELVIAKMPQSSATSRDVPLELSLCVAIRNIGCCAGNSGNFLSILRSCRHFGIVRFQPWILPTVIYKAAGATTTLRKDLEPRTNMQIAMPAIQHHHQRRSQPDGEFNHMAIISGCLGLIFIFAFLLAIFVLRIKCHRTLSTELGETGWRSTDDPSQGHNHTVITVGEEAQSGGEVQGSDEPPKYQAAEPAVRQNDLPPAYESMEVWPERSSRSSRPRQNWTSVWPLRSTQFG